MKFIKLYQRPIFIGLGVVVLFEYRLHLALGEESCTLINLITKLSKMNREIFDERKADLINLIKVSLSTTYISEQDKTSLMRLLELLNQYSFENRLYRKGLLSHTIIDSLELGHSIGEKVVKFDIDIK